MSILFPASKARSNAAFQESFWADLFSLGATRSGQSVTARSSLEVTAVLACCRVLAEGVSQVPLNLYRRRANGKGSDIAYAEPLYDLLHRQPNYWQTSFEFRENMIIQAALAGNFYAYKNKVRGEVREIIPFPPGTVVPERNTKGVITYCATGADGTVQDFPADLIWHVRGPSWDTWRGMGAMVQAREAIGLAMATEDAHAKMHRNGAQLSGTYSVDGVLTEANHKSLTKWINEVISGPDRFKPIILDNGAKWTPMSMSGVDAQHLETRRHQVEEICRAFRMLPIMIGQADKASTFASAEQMFLAHVVHTLMPWYERVEQSMDVNLLTRDQRLAGLYAKFVPNGLMRGASKDRAEYYMKMWQMGALNANEIRELEDNNPYLGGDIYRVQLNTTDASQENPPPSAGL